jgi:sialic acid synthase SpsE/mannose-6-phosphate isomerase-like protein (cupin superfamily)
MSNHFDFNDLFTFEVANNHQGELEHGKRIIREIAAVCMRNKIRGAIKFQFRQFETFIHPAHRQNSANKHVPRFLSTQLTREQFAELKKEVQSNRLFTMCTPFDEASVDLIVEMGFDVLKIGSCSATDWPLLEKASDANLPVIVSTGGLSMKQIDDIVSFFDHRKVHFAIMHCVSLYPTADEKLEMNQIEQLRRRYPDKVIGISSHEHPESVDPVMIAVAKGARIFERHVGYQTDKHKLNAYSSTPEQIDLWVKAALKATAICGGTERAPSKEELDALATLQRGIFAKRPLKTGAVVKREDVYFAMPIEPGSLHAGEWKEGMTVHHEIAKDGPFLREKLEIPHDPEAQILFTAIHAMKGMLNEARIPLNVEFKAEFSHHYGIAKFPEIGTTIIECMNRDYCKKLLIMLPGQHHPSHFHKKKEESFQVMYGMLEVEVDGRRRTLYPGDIQLVPQGIWHNFWSDTGAIFEEISSTHYNDDSYYEDKDINKKQRHERKTVVSNWGRYQIGSQPTKRL